MTANKHWNWTCYFAMAFALSVCGQADALGTGADAKLQGAQAIQSLDQIKPFFDLMLETWEDRPYCSLRLGAPAACKRKGDSYTEDEVKFLKEVRDGWKPAIEAADRVLPFLKTDMASHVADTERQSMDAYLYCTFEDVLLSPVAWKEIEMLGIHLTLAALTDMEEPKTSKMPTDDSKLGDLELPFRVTEVISGFFFESMAPPKVKLSQAGDLLATLRWRADMAEYYLSKWHAYPAFSQEITEVTNRKLASAGFLKGHAQKLAAPMADILRQATEGKEPANAEILLQLARDFDQVAARLMEAGKNLEAAPVKAGPALNQDYRIAECRHQVGFGPKPVLPLEAPTLPEDWNIFDR